MNIALLLSEVSQISKKYELINQKTGGFFNIFDIANIASDEVCICRVIYELINPKGSHYQGDTYLRLFIENVLNMKLSDYDYKNIIVHREKVIKDGRRVDLVIETKDKIIPIEVKIYAGDQHKQCFDYYEYAKNSNVFYLTLRGSCPSKGSAKGLTPIYEDSVVIGYDEVTQISFENEILIWLNKCVSHQETIKVAPIREVILQFMGVIRRMTNLLLEEKEDEIVETILSSKENIKSAIEIERSLQTCKTRMIKKVLESIEERIDSKNRNGKLDISYKTHHYKENNYKPVNTYYNYKKPSYPGVNYFIKSLDKEDVALWLRFEIGTCIYAGFCATYKNKWNGKLLSDKEIEEILKDVEPCADGWWIYWEYLPNDNEVNCPDFKNFNDAYFDLFDENKFEEFIDMCEKSIFNMMEKLK